MQSEELSGADSMCDYLIDRKIELESVFCWRECNGPRRKKSAWQQLFIPTNFPPPPFVFLVMQQYIYCSFCPRRIVHCCFFFFILLFNVHKEGERERERMSESCRQWSSNFSTMSYFLMIKYIYIYIS